MQGQRGVVGSFAETLEFNHGSISGNAFVDQQVYWNHIPDPDGSRVVDLTSSPIHTNNAYVNSSDQEHGDLGGWSFGEPSSSGTQNDLTNFFPINTINMRSQNMQMSNLDSVPQNFNLNVTEDSDDCQIIERPDTFKVTSGNKRISVANGSISSGSGNSSAEGSDSRPGVTLDGHCQSRKRKAVEENIGQSFVAGSSSYYNHSGRDLHTCVIACSDAGNSLQVSAPLEGARPRLGLDAPNMVVAGHGEGAQRNTRIRITPSNQESSLPPLFSMPNVVRRSGTPRSQHSSSLFTADRLLDFRSLPAVNGMNHQSQPALPSVPVVPQNVQTFQLNICSSSTATNPSSSITLGQREDVSTRSAGRNVWEHSLFPGGTDLGTAAGNPPISSVPNGNTSVPVNIASNSRIGLTSGTSTYLSQSRGPHSAPTFRNSRRLAEYVCNALSSVDAVEAMGHGSNAQLPSSLVASSEERRNIPAAHNPVQHHRSHSRTALLAERQGDGVLGIPHTPRTLRGADGRRRLVSEIRNVLDLVRRGEGLRIEDVMMLDQSVFFGFSGIHDRHRDMRFDIDNMSYEELLALEERIGNVSTGLSEETIKSKLKQRKFLVTVENEVEKEPCCICQEEYDEGEDIGEIDCGHGFHADCIKQWLMHKNLCPICKTTGLGK